MLVAFILCTVVFAMSLILSVISILGAFFKNVGTTNFGISSILTVLIPLGMYIFELVALDKDTVWVAYILFAMNLYWLVLQYLFIFNLAIFTQNHIYRLTKYFVLKKYSYSDVTGYSMKKTSGKVLGRFGQKTVYTFDVEISFKDGKYVSFSTKDGTERKIQYIKSLLKEHKCKR